MNFQRSIQWPPGLVGLIGRWWLGLTLLGALLWSANFDWLGRTIPDPEILFGCLVGLVPWFAGLALPIAVTLAIALEEPLTIQRSTGWPLLRIVGLTALLTAVLIVVGGINLEIAENALFHWDVDCGVPQLLGGFGTLSNLRSCGNAWTDPDGPIQAIFLVCNAAGWMFSAAAARLWFPDERLWARLSYGVLSLTWAFGLGYGCQLALRWSPVPFAVSSFPIALLTTPLSFGWFLWAWKAHRERRSTDRQQLLQSYGLAEP